MSLDSSRQIPGYYLDYSAIISFQILLRSSFNIHLPIRSYMASLLRAGRKKPQKKKEGKKGILTDFSEQ
jgi:hypothetical protein